MTYPNVIGEVETLALVSAGKSLARYGDGEFKLCRGHGIKSQRYDQTLRDRLRDILMDSGECWVGIPNIRSETPKASFWQPFAAMSDLLTDRPYASAFITRPDSAPWIDTSEYWQAVEQLWRDQDVTLVRGSAKSLSPDDLSSARSVTDIVCPPQHAYADYDAILERIGTPKRALLSLGPTATVLAVDLCARGVHAIDLGHIALFWRKHRQGLPMGLTKEDKAA